jgi:serine/threonine-protein kinase
VSKEVSEDTVARFLIQNGIIATEKVDAARAAQAESAKRGTRMSLLEALDKNGLISNAEREHIEQQLNSPTTVRVRKLGDYKLIKKLGEGGMGTVYVAEDTTQQRKVALKILSRERARDQAFLTRFQHEARSALKLRHENLVAAYATGDAYGRYYYVMEFCEGEPLDRILTRDGFLPWEKALGIVVQIARGLEYAHLQGFIHRDVKPGNIFMTSGGMAKILDMGLLKHVVGGKQSFSTKPGVVVGSPHYLSPEQIHAEKNIDCRADIYSLGATFYHLLTGDTPYHGESPVMVLMRHLDSPVPNAKVIRPQIPDALARIVQRMMAKNPGDRYKDCKELLADLQTVHADSAGISNSVSSALSNVKSLFGKWLRSAISRGQALQPGRLFGKPGEPGV